MSIVIISTVLDLLKRHFERLTYIHIDGNRLSHHNCQKEIMEVHLMKQFVSLLKPFQKLSGLKTHRKPMKNLFVNSTDIHICKSMCVNVCVVCQKVSVCLCNVSG